MIAKIDAEIKHGDGFGGPHDEATLYKLKKRKAAAVAARNKTEREWAALPQKATTTRRVDMGRGTARVAGPPPHPLSRHLDH